MANELTIRCALNLSRSTGLKDKFDPGTLQIDVSSDLIAAGVVSVGTSEESLPVGDVATIGLLALQNLDPTNYVEFGIASNLCGKLKPGEICFLRLKPGITLKLIANTAACNVKYWLLSD